MSDPGFPTPPGAELPPPPPPPGPDFPPPPPPPPPGGEPGRPGNPWEQRDRLGAATGFFEAWKLFVLSPGEAFSRTRESGDLASPLLFGLVFGWLGVIVSELWNLAFGSSILALLPAAMRAELAPHMVFSAARLAAQLLLAPLVLLVVLFVWAAILHVCLMLVGGTSRSRAGFEGSFRAVAYASVANSAQIVPLIGGLIATIWSIVLQVIGLVKLHRASEGRAVAAVLLPILLCCGCCAVVLLMFGAAIVAAIAGAKG